MRRRMWLMQNVSSENGWKKKSIIPSSDLMKGDNVVSAINAELPQNYRYAIALRNNVESLEPYAFICCSILPTSSYVLAIRITSSGGGMQSLPQINSPTYDVRVRSGEQIDIYWREHSIGADTPVTSWEYKTLQPGAMTNAQSVKNALTGIGSWDALISVADIDFATELDTNNTYCRCAVYDSSNLTGTYERYRNNAYNTVQNWTQQYDLVIGNTTKLANFYLV